MTLKQSSCADKLQLLALLHEYRGVYVYLCVLISGLFSFMILYFYECYFLSALLI